MLEVLIAEPVEKGMKIIGTQPSDMPVVDSSKSLLFASKKTLEIVKKSLQDGLGVFISETITGNEVRPSDLIIVKYEDPLKIAKNMALVDITNLINQNVFGMSILDSMDFLMCLLKLMNAGIFITDENREDKYFEIIEAAQTIEEPKPLDSSSTFEDEQKYRDEKAKYDTAQANLATLEKYLNAYDKLAKVKFVNDLLNSAKENINKSETVQEVETIIKEYSEKINKYFHADPCST